MSQFKIVLQEKTASPGGRHVEVLGSYNPHQKVAVLKEDRIQYWLKNGVDVSDSAYNLFVGKGLIDGNKRKVKIPEKQAQEAEPEKTEETQNKPSAEENAGEKAKE